jgi:hypothetical protein
MHGASQDRCLLDKSPADDGFLEPVLLQNRAHGAGDLLVVVAPGWVPLGPVVDPGGVGPPPPDLGQPAVGEAGDATGEDDGGVVDLDVDGPTLVWSSQCLNST